MSENLFLSIIITLTALGTIYVLLRRELKNLLGAGKREDELKDIVNQVFGEVTQKVATQTKAILESDKEAIYQDNTHKKDLIESMIKELKKEIDERQKEIRDLESDRNKKFGDITRAIEEHRKITDELKASTETLSRVLSNNQTRGAWGERIIEDILRSAGLVEGIHYLKQATLGDTTVRPDVTLLLPNERKVAIDVKFPYAAIQEMAKAETKGEKELQLKHFEADLKEKMNQIEKRGYINVEQGTLDYAIMFVPNEMLFSFINQQFPGIIDDAMSRKIMLVSPFTFLIVARTVMESYRNFMIENNLRKIIKHISEFIEEWSRFTTEFGKFDESISRLRDSFDKITTTRYKMMESKIKKIESYRQGTELVPTPSPTLDTSTEAKT